MITPGYGMTATERVLPRMALDFTTGVIDPRVTVARLLNTATSVNSSGLIELVNANLPRFDYDPVTLAPKGLLIEEARTNPILQSAAFNAVNYGKVASSIDPNVAVSPDGGTNADEFIVDGTTGAHYLQQANTGMVSSSTYTWSVYAKANTMPYLVLSLYNTTANNYACASFDLATATVENTGAAGTGISVASTFVFNAGNGWYRYIITAVAGTNAFNRCGIGMSLDGTVAGTLGFPSFAGNSTDSLYLWGAQLETGAFATSYIPTTTTSLTRNADVVSMTGTNFSDWYNASEGAFSVSYIASNATKNQNALVASNGTATERMGIRCINSSSQSIIIGVAASVTQWNVAINGQTINTLTSACWTYKVDSIAWARGGANAGTDTSAIVPTVNQLRIGADETGANLLNGHIQKINYWPQRITNSETTAFSK
jgi:hypothetical protein